MTGPSDDDEARALRARKNLKRVAKAVEFEAYEDAELRREEAGTKLSPKHAKSAVRPNAAGPQTGRRKGMASQRGK